MKIREIRVKDVRNFTGMRSVKLYDEATNLVRPLTVLVGSNGTGKSTLLEIIWGLLSYAVEPAQGPGIQWEVRSQGYASIDIEFEPNAPPELKSGMTVALGRRDHIPDGLQERPGQIARFDELAPAPWRVVEGPRAALNEWISSMIHETAPMRSGLIYFPHDRWIEHVEQGAIEPPPKPKGWIQFVSPARKWSGSLSQLWVWQNYLDLEQGARDRRNLIRYVDVVERVLGQDQKIFIREGRVLIERPATGDSIEPDRLPSGQQQVLAIFGELARYLRPGAVILIDEVEISLHPGLQRSVLFHLRKLAAEYDLQLIVTTHSMAIVDAVAPSEVINLDDMVLTERAQSQGRSE